MERVPPADLSPGDVIQSPGGEAVVTGVEPVSSLVRVAFTDRCGPAFVHLPRTRPVLRLRSAAADPTVVRTPRA